MQSASDFASNDVLSSLARFLPSAEGSSDDEEYAEEMAEQFVQSVDDFSSQYGSEVSISYTALNLRGPPSNFPDYGDYPQAFVMRTYGRWWEEAPSAQEDFMPQNNPTVPSQDFVEVSFEYSVVPHSVNIFETYNPGAVVRVWALRPNNRWALLWSGEPQPAGDSPRIFSPPIDHQATFHTRTLRLELNHRDHTYYTELDAVLLRGRRLRLLPSKPVSNFYTSLFSWEPNQKEIVLQRGELMSRIIASNLHKSVMEPQLEAEKLAESHGNIQSLPDETILKVLSLLDLRSLWRVAAVDRHLRRLALDSMLYRTISLRPYWNCFNSEALMTLSQRCRYLQKLDLSWCGNHGLIVPALFICFMNECGSQLTHLRLSNCKFVDNHVLKAVTQRAKNLQELCLANAGWLTDWMWLATLQQLQRLDVYRTPITTAAAVAAVRSNPGLRHVNFGACWKVSDMDEVAVALGASCAALVSADFWKSYTLSAQGVRALARCRRLEELDVGWCLQAGTSGDWVASLSACPLRKLCLGALRGVTERDVRSLAAHADLAQLDLLGVRAATYETCALILAECRALRLLDLSFCDQVSDAQIELWRQEYPHVSIKRSFQNTSQQGDSITFVQFL